MSALVPTLPAGIAVVGLAVLAALVTASVAVVVLRWRAADRDWAELTRRVITWWVMIALLSAAIAAGRTALVVFLGFVSFLALKEYFSRIPTRRVDRPVLLWAYLAIPVQYLWAGMGWYPMFLVFIPVWMFLLIPVGLILTGRTEGFLRAIGSTHWGLMVTVFSLSHAALFVGIGDWPEAPAGGLGLFLFLVVLTQANDVLQYLCGKWLGRRRIMPAVSPNKTWAGAIGGVLGTAALSLALAPLLTPYPVPFALLAGVLIGIAGFFGDLTVSALKRDLGIKDSGTLLPGHGGILDRVDSLFFTAPALFHFTYYFFM